MFHSRFTTNFKAWTFLTVLNLEKTVGTANVLGGTRPKYQSAEGYDTITRLAVTESITKAIATYGIHPKRCPEMEDRAPQLNSIYEEIVLRNPDHSGRYEKLREAYVFRDVVSAKEFMIRNMTKTALCTDQNSLFQSTPLVPLLMSLTHQLSKINKDVNKPLLSGGLMSNNVPQHAFRSMSDTTPYAALYMIRPNNVYTKDEYGERVNHTDMINMEPMVSGATVTEIEFLCGFLFVPMNPTPDLEQQLATRREMWIRERKKHYKSAGRSSLYNMGDDDIDDYCVLDASSTEDSLTPSNENDKAPDTNVPRSHESDSNDDDDDDVSSDDDSDWMPQNDHGKNTTNALIIIIVPYNPSLTITNCKTQ